MPKSKSKSKTRKKSIKEMQSPLEGLNGQLMITAAHRYCLGRQSYIVGAGIEWLTQWWPNFERNTRNVMVRDTVVALMDNEAGSQYDWEAWRGFVEWAWNGLDTEGQDWVKQSVAYKNKPWPLDDDPHDPPSQFEIEARAKILIEAERRRHTPDSHGDDLDGCPCQDKSH